jgi:dTDP-glucose 4,6-dehydratase/UDP-glucose 4-epimerase
MKVLIIGSEGFIGSHCVDFFSASGHLVAGLDLYEQPSRRYAYTKITRLSPEFDEVFGSNHFDAVINASGSSNVSYSMTHPLSDFEANCLDTIRVLDAIRKYQKDCGYIHLSSAAVYGNPAKLPVQETDLLLPLSAYGWHKLAAENLCREYSSLYKLNIAILRPFSVYGPGLKKQLFWDLFQKSRGRQGKFELFGTGKESRDYIHISDMMRAFALVLEKAAMRGEAYNLASGNETTIAKAVDIFFRALALQPDYCFNGQVRSGDPLNWCADTKKINQLGFSCEIDLPQGLKEVAGWLKELDLG